MAKPLKIVLLVAGGLLVLLVGALITAALLFNPNDYRQQISNAVKQQTGRELQLGEIGMKVFPWLRVSIADARLGNAAGFGDAPFAQVKQVSVGVQLLPLLLDRQIKVSTVSLDGLNLNLAKNADGVSNWQDLIDHQKNKPDEQKTDDSGDKKSGFKLDQINIEGIAINDAALIYDDQQKKAHYEVQKLHLKTGALTLDKPFDVDLAATLISTAPQAQVAVTLSGTVKPDATSKTIDTDGLKLTVKGSAAGYALDTELGARLVADLNAKIFNLNALALKLQAKNASLPGGEQTLSLSGDLGYNLPQGALRFSKVKLQGGGLTLTTDVTGKGLNGDQPQIDAPISIAAFSPRQLLESLGIKLVTSDPKALSKATLSTHYTGSFKTASLRDLLVTLDATTIKGKLDITDFKTQYLVFALNVDGIDADRYLPPKSKSAGADTGKPEAAGSGAAKKDVNAVQLPTAALDKLNAEGVFGIGKLKIDNLQLSDIRLQLGGHGTQPKQQDLSAALYGGTIRLSHRYTPGSTPASTPGFAVKGQLTSFEAAPFLKDLVGKDYVSGTADLALDLNGRGKTVGDLRHTLAGKVSAVARNGAVKGFNLGQLIRKSEAMLNGNLNYQETSAPATDFTAITVSGTISNGVLHSDDLNAASPLFRVGGAGDIDLANETIDYTAKPTIVNTATGQDGKALDNLNGVMIPIKLSGNLFKPKYKIDLQSAVRQKATEKIREQLNDKKTELKQKLGSKLSEFLYGKPKPAPAPESAPASPPAQ